MAGHDPHLHVEKFGPIDKASIDLRPLTVFIGPNNSGKTYLAKLVYAMNTALSLESFLRPNRRRDPWLDYLTSLDSSLPRRSFKELPTDLRDQYEHALQFIGNHVTQALELSIWRYFGHGELDALRNTDASNETVLITYGSSVPGPDKLQVTLRSGIERPQQELSLPSLDELSLPVVDDFSSNGGSESDVNNWRFGRWIWNELIKINGLPFGESWYLPSGRSGLLAGAQVIRAAAMSIVAQQVGLERIELGPVSGVEGDFIRTDALGIPADANLLDRDEWSPELASALLLLEELMGGAVLVRSVGPGRPVIVYRRGELELPMERSSSMVAELAAVQLWTKALLRRGDMLIIDEPEAHLHPSKQRLMARVLVRLVNAGIRVVCPTHSSLILHQISNCMMASRVDAANLPGLGLQSSDIISFDNVSAYLFETRSGGSRVSPVEIDPEFGIAEDEFIRVAEAIGEQTYGLTVAAEERDPVPTHGD